MEKKLMSTRAIIALPVTTDNGEVIGYETAWCWNDGSPGDLGAELRRYFKTEETVKELLKLHSFSSIWGPKMGILDVMNVGDECVMLSNNRLVLMHPHNGSVVAGQDERGFFATILEMVQQDLNYVYTFEDGKWTTHTMPIPPKRPYWVFELYIADRRVGGSGDHKFKTKKAAENAAASVIENLRLDEWYRMFSPEDFTIDVYKPLM
jgi:hypothetical protein